MLLALVAGIALGVAVAASGNASLIKGVGWLETIGLLWINAIRMTVIPLVVGAIIVGVADTPELGLVGRVGGRAVLLFLLILFGAAAFAVIVAPPILSFLDIDPPAAAALRASASQASASAVENAQKIQSLRQWLLDLIPTNPIKAAADGAMLPLIVFSVAFAIALTRIAAASRDTFLNFARALRDASLTLVRWILVAAPLGVFALSVAIAQKLGAAAAGAVVFYIVLVCAMCVAFMALLYAAVFLLARPGVAFPAIWAPAQAVGFSSRASMVALPAMITASEAMQQPLVIRSFFLPLAVAVFRAGSAINIPVGVLFLAQLYGVDVGAAQLVTIALMSVVTTFTIPSIPGGTIIVMVPVLLAAGLPVAGIGILLGIDTLPDMFRTITHVTGDLTVASLLSRTKSR